MNRAHYLAVLAVAGVLAVALRGPRPAHSLHRLRLSGRRPAGHDLPHPAGRTVPRRRRRGDRLRAGHPGQARRASQEDEPPGHDPDEGAAQGAHPGKAGAGKAGGKDALEGLDPAMRKLVEKIQSRMAEYVNRPACVALADIVILDVTIGPDAEPGRHEIRLTTLRGVTNPMAFYVGQTPEVSRKPMRTADVPGARQGGARPAQPGPKTRWSSASRCPAPSTARSPPARSTGTASRRQGPAPGLLDQGPRPDPLSRRRRARLVPARAGHLRRRGQGAGLRRRLPFQARSDHLLRSAPRRRVPVQHHRRHLPRPRGLRLSHHRRRAAVRDQHLPAGRPGGRAGRRRDEGLEPRGGRAGAAAARRGAGHVPARGDHQGGSRLQPRALRARHAAGVPRPGAQRRPRPRPEGHASRHRQRPHRPPGRLGRVPDPRPGRRDRRGRGHGPPARFPARLRAQADRRRPARCWPSTTTTKTSGRGSTRTTPIPTCMAKLPEDGTYYVHLGDVGRHGGQEYGYRLRISPPRPDFELRVAPSARRAAQQEGHAADRLRAPQGRVHRRHPARSETSEDRVLAVARHAVGRPDPRCAWP